MFLFTINLMKTYILALCVSIAFAAIKFVEKKMTNSASTPADIVKNAVAVYLSVYVGEFILQQSMPAQTATPPEVFVSEPGF